MNVVDFCDYQDDKGHLCNRTPEYVVHEKEFDVYLCDRCLHIYEPSLDATTVCFNQP